MVNCLRDALHGEDGQKAAGISDFPSRAAARSENRFLRFEIGIDAVRLESR
jgi:hypothetical protein